MEWLWLTSIGLAVAGWCRFLLEREERKFTESCKEFWYNEARERRKDLMRVAKRGDRDGDEWKDICGYR